MLNKYRKILKLYGNFRNHKYVYYLYPYYSLLKKLKKYRPMFAEIFFESRCNFRCWHCSSAEMLNKGIHLTIDQIDVILRKLKSVGVLSVCYVGGEPTIRKDLPDIVRLDQQT